MAAGCLHLSIPAATKIGCTVDSRIGKDAVTATLIADNWLRIATAGESYVCEVLAAVTQDGRTGLSIRRPAGWGKRRVMDPASLTPSPSISRRVTAATDGLGKRQRTG